MSHVFVSYVREDSDVVDYLVGVLRNNGLKVFLDRDSLQPGVLWKTAIRSAIRDGTYFLAVFSRAWTLRTRSTAYDELNTAIEEIRSRPSNLAWFLPIRIDECIVPNTEIRAGLQLDDIQRADVPDRGWGSALGSLLRAMGVQKPVLDSGEPLAPGLLSSAEVANGEFTCDALDPPLPHMIGMTFSVSGGSIRQHSKGGLFAFVQTRAPYSQLQAANTMLGLDSFYVRSQDTHLSLDSEKPNKFGSLRQIIFPKGIGLPDLQNGRTVMLPFDILASVEYTATGSLTQLRFKGKYDGTIIYDHPNCRVTVRIAGSFDIGLAKTSGS